MQVHGVTHQKTADFILISVRTSNVTISIILFKYSSNSTVGYAKTNDTTTNECYNEQILSIKSGCSNQHRCYNERGGILSADVARECA